MEFKKLMRLKRSNSRLHFEKNCMLPLTAKIKDFRGPKKQELFLECKRSQMQIQEMSFMLVGLAVFFMIVLLFYVVISLSGLKQRVAESTREGNILLVSMLAGTPEFSCAEKSTSLCVDGYKVLALKNNLNYASFWNVDGLKIQKFYPYTNNTIECSIGNYDICNTITLVKEKPTEVNNLHRDSSYVTLCVRESENDYLYSRCELAKIIVSTKTTT